MAWLVLFSDACWCSHPMRVESVGVRVLEWQTDRTEHEMLKYCEMLA